MTNLIRGISENGGVIFCGLDSTELVRKACKIHETSATCSAALGRLLTAASMMGIMMKNKDDHLTLRFQGDGPAGVALATADGMGMVKGYISNPTADLPAKENGHLDVGGVIGKEGTLTVIRKDSGMSEPYVGQIPIVSGEIAEDITNYYAVSEQIPTVCALGVLVDTDLSIISAGGFLVQLLPGATEEEISQLEKNISGMPGVSQLLQEGNTPEQLMYRILDGFNPNVLDAHQVDIRCDCSRERTRQILLSLGRKELTNMRDENPLCEVNCHFCNAVYSFDLNELLADAENAQPAQ